MRPVPDNAFERFVVQRKKDLQRIARHTGGEHQLTDVLHEAWIMAANLQAPNGTHLDLENAACQEKLLSHLYQHLVRYTEQNVRRAIRLDHAAPGHDLDDDVHPLTYLLISDEGQDPLGRADRARDDLGAGCGPRRPWLVGGSICTPAAPFRQQNVCCCESLADFTLLRLPLLRKGAATGGASAAHPHPRIERKPRSRALEKLSTTPNTSPTVVRFRRRASLQIRMLTMAKTAPMAPKPHAAMKIPMQRFSLVHGQGRKTMGPAIPSAQS